MQLNAVLHRIWCSPKIVKCEYERPGQSKMYNEIACEIYKRMSWDQVLLVNALIGFKQITTLHLALIYNIRLGPPVHSQRKKPTREKARVRTSRLQCPG